jgi:hypothetical protein
MPPSRSKPTFKKQVKVTVIPPSKKPRKTFFEEYYYGVLGAEFIGAALLFIGMGFGFYRGTLVGLLITAMTAVGWQFRQYFKYRGVPAPLPAPPKSELKPLRPVGKPKFPVGPDGKKIFPPSYFPPLMDRKPKK